MFEKLPEACASGIFLRRKREMAPMGNAAAFPEHLAEGNSTAQVHWCTARSPDVSLRGAKRRGNLAEHGRTTGKPSAKSQLPSRDCHVGLRPPRNDKSGAITVLSPTCTYRQYSAGPGCPLPYNALLILRTGPAWHRGKWPHGRGADIPVLSCNTRETPAPSRCRGRGPRA